MPKSMNKLYSYGFRKEFNKTKECDVSIKLRKMLENG